MLSTKRLLKASTSVLIPLLLFILLIFQLERYHLILSKRNEYLLESLPESSQWVWNAMSGKLRSQLFETGDDPNVIKASDKLLQASSVTSLGARNLVGNVSDILVPGLPSLVVHYLWCVDGYFELGHYVSVLSVLHQLQPDRIVIHYRTKPRSDPHGYWHWLEDLQRDVVLLSMRPLADSRHCRHDLSAGVRPDRYDFPDAHGVFLVGDIAIVNLTRVDIVNQMKQFRDNDMRRNQIFIVSEAEPYRAVETPGQSVITCPPVALFNQKNRKGNMYCVSINMNINPNEMFVRDTQFNRYVRTVLYNSPDPVQSDVPSEVQISNSVHIILLDGIGEVTPVIYASIKSAYVKGKADYVYVHGHTPPSGALWERLHQVDKVKVNYIPTAPSDQYSLKFGDMVYALYTLLLYGGTAHFGDIIFVSPLTSTARHAPAIATAHRSQYRMKHPSINTAIMAAAKGSKFVESTLAMVRQVDLFWPYATVDDITTHIGELHPSWLRMDPSLISHLRCDATRCEVAGGYAPPTSTYTARLLWSNDQPKTLEELQSIEGPAKSLVREIVHSSSHKSLVGG